MLKKKVTLIEDSSSEDKLDERPKESQRKSAMTDTKISDIFLEIRNQMIQEQQLNETNISYSKKKEIVEEEDACNAENEEFTKFHVTY